MIFSDLIITDKEKVTLDEVFLSVANRQVIGQLVKEYQYNAILDQYGLPVSNKLILHGSSGCGKTTTAKAIAYTLNKPLLVLNLSTIICARIGESAQNMRQVFQKAGREQAVLFLDEFDQIGKARDSDDREVGEMRRIVNTLIQLIDYYPNNSLLIAATNHNEIIDHALLRRFQLSIRFEKPANSDLDKYYDQLIGHFPDELKGIDRIYDLSYAEAKDHAFTQVKARLLYQLEQQDK